MSDLSFTKWVACWGTATSIAERKEATYAKNLTLRYPIRVVFSGSKMRFHFSNFTGTEAVTISKAFVTVRDAADYKPVPITLAGKTEIVIPAGKDIVSDDISFAINAGQTIDVSMYFADFTQMTAGTLVSGPLSKGQYAYGDFANQKDLPSDLSTETEWFYFLNTVDVFTEEKNHALICYGDSITAQAWPDYLAQRAWDEGFHNVAIIRRAISGSRILRQYDCIRYANYGLKGETRFPMEVQAAGVTTVIILHGVNDIIHPVGVETNKFRPMSDLPTAQDLQKGMEDFYISKARELGLKVWSATLLPILGWSTYKPFRDEIRNEFNEWLRTSNKFDGCIDFEKAVQNPQKPEVFIEGLDSGDHLHPSEAGHKVLAQTVPESLLM